MKWQLRHIGTPHLNLGHIKFRKIRPNIGDTISYRNFWSTSEKHFYKVVKVEIEFADKISYILYLEDADNE